MSLTRVAAVVVATTMLITGCSGAPTPPETPLAAPTTAAPASPLPWPSPTVSRQVSPPPPIKTKTIEWYVSQLPKFPAAPTPERIRLPEGTSAPMWHRVPTSQRVAFITIDDGALARSAEARELIKRAHIPVTLFLNSPAATRHTDYFKAIQESGGVVENHTITHANLKGKPYDFQRREICGGADRLAALFGRRPTLFRPPFGERDSITLRAARDCGVKVVLHWSETVDKGIVRYQTAKKEVRPGDVLLMHFRPALADDLLAALRAIYKAGLTPALLEDYVG